MKTAIVVGHTQVRPGACSPHGIKCEWEFNKEIAESLKDVADIFLYDSYNLGYTSMVKRNASKINKGDYKLVLELHYNAATPSANGCEALYYFKNQNGKKLAEKFCEIYTKDIGGKNRGAKALVKSSDRGFAAVYYPQPTALILEPFFGTNKKDVETIMNCYHQYEQVIRKLIDESKNIL